MNIRVPALFVLSAVALAVSLEWIFTPTRFHSSCAKHVQPANVFSHSYAEARALFRRSAEDAGLVVTPLVVIKADTKRGLDIDLTIDIVLVPGSNDRTIVHLSGTHGVEGYAGSAIQSHILQHYKSEFKQAKANSDRPSIVFVHAVNPFGFHFNRRWNENNVDLNRNFMNESLFAKVLSWAPNKFGYASFDFLMNPRHVLGTDDLFFLRTGYNIARYGFAPLKKTLINGQYHAPKGIFYGGAELQQSHRKLLAHLVSLDAVKSAKKTLFLDVHTGLGPAGEDSLLTETPKDYDLTRDMFGEGLELRRLGNLNNSSNPAQADAYSDTHGFTPTGLVAEMGTRYPSQDAYSVTQEFGTVPGLLVFKAMREENAAYHWSSPAAESESTRRFVPDTAEWRAAAKRLRDVFYLEDSCQWRADVADRGLAVFRQAYERF